MHTTVLQPIVWHTSSYSSVNGQCVEVASLGATVLIRDSKGVASLALSVTPDTFRAFLGRVKSGAISSA